MATLSGLTPGPSHASFAAGPRPPRPRRHCPPAGPGLCRPPAGRQPGRFHSPHSLPSPARYARSRPCSPSHFSDSAVNGDSREKRRTIGTGWARGRGRGEGLASCRPPGAGAQRGPRSGWRGPGTGPSRSPSVASGPGPSVPCLCSMAGWVASFGGWSVLGQEEGGGLRVPRCPWTVPCGRLPCHRVPTSRRALGGQGDRRGLQGGPPSLGQADDGYWNRKLGCRGWGTRTQTQ